MTNKEHKVLGTVMLVEAEVPTWMSTWMIFLHSSSVVAEEVVVEEDPDSTSISVTVGKVVADSNEKNLLQIFSKTQMSMFWTSAQYSSSIAARRFGLCTSSTQNCKSAKTLRRSTYPFLRNCTA